MSTKRYIYPLGKLNSDKLLDLIKDFSSQERADQLVEIYRENTGMDMLLEYRPFHISKIQKDGSLYIYGKNKDDIDVAADSLTRIVQVRAYTRFHSD